ncbi:hypothetical protein ABPG74_013884 [Tetrahymena malaccensis]
MIIIFLCHVPIIPEPYIINKQPNNSSKQLQINLISNCNFNLVFAFSGSSNRENMKKKTKHDKKSSYYLFKDAQIKQQLYKNIDLDFFHIYTKNIFLENIFLK